jgi:hypothetical protein
MGKNWKENSVIRNQYRFLKKCNITEMPKAGTKDHKVISLCNFVSFSVCLCEIGFLKETPWMTIYKLIRLQILEPPIRQERYFTTRCLADELFQVIYKGIKAVFG